MTLRIAIGSDEAAELTSALIAELDKRGHQVIPFGPLATQGCSVLRSRPTTPALHRRCKCESSG